MARSSVIVLRRAAHPFPDHPAAVGESDVHVFDAGARQRWPEGVHDARHDLP